MYTSGERYTSLAKHLNTARWETNSTMWTGLRGSRRDRKFTYIVRQRGGQPERWNVSNTKKMFTLWTYQGLTDDQVCCNISPYDDVMTWKRLPHCLITGPLWSESLEDSPYKWPVIRSLVVFFMLNFRRCWTNSRVVSDLRRHCKTRNMHNSSGSAFLYFSIPETYNTQELPCHRGPGPHIFKIYSH